MTGLPLKKRCQRDECLAGPSPSSLLEAANALTELSGTPPASDDESDGSVGTSGCMSLSSMCETSSDTGRDSPAHSFKSTDSSSFPEKLMEIVQSEDGGGSKAISWLPSGDGFIISNAKNFTLEVLPKYFSQQTEFSSFTRKLYWWGFKKTSRGLNCNSFQHELFRRDDPKLCLKMRGRCSGRKRKSKQARSQVKANALLQSPGGQVNRQPVKSIPPQQGPAQTDVSKFLAQASSFYHAQATQQARQQAMAYQMAIQQARAKLLCQSQQLSLGGLNGLLPALQMPTARLQVMPPAKASPQQVVIHVHHH